ncbi:MAG: hypothetical protein EBU97_01900 [Rhodobacteraceae bacterium]|nr:hypothetical protein [Paracoccaceae bacterium]
MRLRTLSLMTLTCASLAACGSGGGNMQLYPIQGPYAQQSPPPVVEISANTKTDTSGEIRFRLPKPSKARCSGTWTSVQPKTVTRKKGFSLSLTGPGGNLGRDIQSVGGINHGEVYAVCSDGTVVQGSFVIGSGTQSGTGTVTDTLGNTYKLLF